MKRARPPQKAAAKPAARNHHAEHIHCIACGRHIEPSELSSVVAVTATILTCDHGSRFAACAEHAGAALELLAEHDRTGRPVRAAPAWH